MNFYIIIGTLYMFLNVNVEPNEGRLVDCLTASTWENEEGGPENYGFVCVLFSCNFAEDCKEEAVSEVLEWETDIFEVGFEEVEFRRPKELVIKIVLNKDYYVEIKLTVDEEKETNKVILNECSHTGKTCLKVTSITHYNFKMDDDHTYVAIGFRKDKKINFAAVSKFRDIASNLFGRKNEFEFKMPGFYFNTDETMKITVSGKFYKTYDENGFVLILPTSVGGFLFDEDGYMIDDGNSDCTRFYDNPNLEEGIRYILKEYYDNSVDWKATPVKYSLPMDIEYFNESGMLFNREQMTVKKEKNPNFDAQTMIRNGCYIIQLPAPPPTPPPPTTTIITTTTTTTTTTRKLKEESRKTEVEDSRTTKPDDFEGNEVTIPLPQLEKDKRQLGISILEPDTNISFHEITINEVTFVSKDDPWEENININVMVKLKNGSFVDLKNLKFGPPKNETKKTGSGGDGDASRGKIQVKNISPTYTVILILMILSM